MVAIVAFILFKHNPEGDEAIPDMIISSNSSIITFKTLIVTLFHEDCVSEPATSSPCVPFVTINNHSKSFWIKYSRQRSSCHACNCK
jgi:hypothetical protein